MSQNLGKITSTKLLSHKSTVQVSKIENHLGQKLSHALACKYFLYFYKITLLRWAVNS